MMENYVVIDLEMCNVPKSQRTSDYHWATETIQIGAVKLNSEYDVVEEFNTYVSPSLGHINHTITKLTGIHPHQVKGAPSIENALELLYAWLPDQPVMVAWSDADYNQFSYEIQGKNLPNRSILDFKWVDCQKIFDEKIGAFHQYSLLNALNLSDIDYREQIHDGLADAYNTALLFKKLTTEPDYQFNEYYRSMTEGGRKWSI